MFLLLYIILKGYTSGAPLSNIESKSFFHIQKRVRKDSSHQMKEYSYDRRKQYFSGRFQRL